MWSPPPPAACVRADRARKGDRSLRGSAAPVPRARRRARPPSRPTRPVDLDAIRPDLAEVRARHACGLERPGPRPWRAAARPASARRARTSTISAIPAASSNTARWRSPRSARAAARRTARARPPPTAWSAASAASTATFRREIAPLRGHRLRLHGAGRHPGPQEPQEAGPATELARAPGCRGAVRRGRRRAAGRHRERCRRLRRRSADLSLFGGLSGPGAADRIVSGRCFAGNAALLGCCDVIIATQTPTSAWAARR